jgi:transcription elongation factor Elf1
LESTAAVAQYMNYGNHSVKKFKSTGKDGKDISHITCHNCQKKEHYAADCYARTTVSGKWIDEYADSESDEEYESDDSY